MYRDQCEELRGIKFKQHLVEVTKDRGEQLRLQEEEKKRNVKGKQIKCGMYLLMNMPHLPEEAIYAKMWKEDWAVKSKREDMEAALQIERNKEMLEVGL